MEQNRLVQFSYTLGLEIDLLQVIALKADTITRQEVTTRDSLRWHEGGRFLRCGNAAWWTSHRVLLHAAQFL